MGRMAEAGLGLLERALGGLGQIGRERGSLRGHPQHLLTGMDGERAAFFHLRRNGYVIVARRWSSGGVPGDLDLIAWQGPMLCFVEVKTRTAHDITPAEAAVDRHKRVILRRLARAYIRQLPGEAAPPVRFDVMSVYLIPGAQPEFEHFENAFGMSERRDRN